MLDKYPTHWADAYTDNMDANTADVWFQLCCLGEIVYG